MIKIHVKCEKDVVNYIKISGHSGYADYGNDIVCASISSICITTVNALVRYDEGSVVYSEADGLLEIGILNHDNIINMLVDNMLNLFEGLMDQYPKNVKILK